MRTRTITISCVAMLILCGQDTDGAENAPGSSLRDEPFHVQLGRSVFRLEHEETITRLGQEKPELRLVSDGTAFGVRYRGNDYIITARHVAVRPYDLRARVPSLVRATKQTEVVELRIPKEAWVFTPQETSTPAKNNRSIPELGIDVAAAILPGIRDRMIVVFDIGLTEAADATPGVKAENDPLPPRSVFVAGFPGDLGFTLAEQRPVLRSGIVSLQAGEHMLQVNDAWVDARAFLLDIKVHAGNSGGPVFDVDLSGRRPRVVGLIMASNDKWDYAVAEPLSRIREVLEETSIKGALRSSAEWHLLKQVKGRE